MPGLRVALARQGPWDVEQGGWAEGRGTAAGHHCVLLQVRQVQCVAVAERRHGSPSPLTDRAKLQPVNAHGAA